MSSIRAGYLIQSQKLVTNHWLLQQTMDFNFGEIVEPTSRAFYDDYDDSSLNLPFKRFVFIAMSLWNIKKSLSDLFGCGARMEEHLVMNSLRT